MPEKRTHDRFRLRDFWTNPTTGDRVVENDGYKRSRLQSGLGGIAMGAAWAAAGEVLLDDRVFTLGSGVVMGIVIYNQLRGNKVRDIWQGITARLRRE
ncbi:TPA: hypothetical protein DIS56_02395 [Candidatus Saccharibacteria bacterium]|nr:MAG: hypothetical protein UX30_C0005G0021 [Candidatus Saccharibacteria bacterium GW2011_GWA2_46_10]OGL34390.1 MAG: hypothetical protein A3F05_03330 [Candidatus Saccharibacteria bacterium RIFCSPHIGHO2_12_FULL_47_17]HCM51960.1 hypothetical protein [Candidatus Saccharibacteria bacterium]